MLQDLVDEINSQRFRVSGSSQGALRQHQHIEALHTTLVRLNSGMGPGFIFFGAVIDTDWLQALGIKLVSFVIVAGPFLMKLTHMTTGQELGSLDNKWNKTVAGSL